MRPLGAVISQGQHQVGTQRMLYVHIPLLNVSNRELSVDRKAVQDRELWIDRKAIRQCQNTIGPADQIITGCKRRLAGKLRIELVVDRGVVKDAIAASYYSVLAVEWFPSQPKTRRKIVAVRIDQ